MLGVPAVDFEDAEMDERGQDCSEIIRNSTGVAPCGTRRGTVAAAAASPVRATDCGKIDIIVEYGPTVH